MTRELLLARLFGASDASEPREKAIEQILEFINDQAISDAYERLPRHECLDLCEECGADV